LIQSSGPLFVALWSLVLFGVRLTLAQFAGIILSLTGVLVIILRGDLAALAAIHFNRGDLMFGGAVLSFGLYSALMPYRPRTHALSLITFTIGCGAVLLLPFSLWEFFNGITLKPDALTVATLLYVMIFPLDAFLPVLQPRHRADRPQSLGALPAPGAGIRLGDGDPAARRAAKAVSPDRLRPSAGRHRDRLAAGVGAGLNWRCGGSPDGLPLRAGTG
jgi:hypothetical protein